MILVTVTIKHMSSQRLTGVPCRKAGFIAMALLGVRCPRQLSFYLQWGSVDSLGELNRSMFHNVYFLKTKYPL